MSPCLHSADPRQTYRKNCRVFPHNCPVPSGSSTSSATMPARALAKALLHPNPTPSATLVKDQFSSIQRLSRIFSNVTAGPPTAPAPNAPLPAPDFVFQTYCPALSLRVPELTPIVFPSMVTIVSTANIPNTPPPSTCVYRPSPSRTIYTGAGPSTKSCHHQTRP